MAESRPGKKKIMIILSVCSTKMSDKREKAYQTSMFNKIVQTINGFLNSEGGQLVLQFDNLAPPNHIKESIRKIEQKIYDFTSVVLLVHYLTIIRKNESMEIAVSRPNTDCIYTLHSNLYLPTNQQVIELSPKEPVKDVRDILCRKAPWQEAVKPGSHCKEFTLNSAVSFGESQTVQFKQFSETRTKNCNLAQRLITSGKLSIYVSAFANYEAGHIYIGIDDNGIVQGEKITPKDKAELKDKISKAIGSMIWPDDSHAQGKEEKRWQIQFEEVKDKNGEIVPSTYIIVIYVAHCPGGVFTKEPEAYEIKDNEAKRIDFPTWKKCIVEGLERDQDGCGAQTDETSDEGKVDEMLTELLNDNCQWKELKEAAEKAQTRASGETDIRLICLSKLIKYCIRKGNYEKADELFEEYKIILPKSNKKEIFEIMEQYLYCLKERSVGNFENSYEIAKNCLDKLEEMQPGIVSAAFFVLIATVVNIIAMMKKGKSERSPYASKAKEFYDKAERHLQYVHGFEAAKADLRQKVYMNETMLFCGSSLAGFMLPDSDNSIISRTEAQNCLDKSQHIITHELFPLSDFREIQHNLANSDFVYRYINTDKPRRDSLKKALKFAKRAQKSASDAGLPEMENYAKNRVGLIQQEIDLRS